MRVVLACLLLVTAVLAESDHDHDHDHDHSHDHDHDHDHDDDHDRMTPEGVKMFAERARARADGVDFRITRLNEKYDSMKADFDQKMTRADAAKYKIQHLEDRLYDVESDGCGKRNFQCGDLGHHCVSDLFVCDGSNDCKNGHDEDESVCKNHAAAGTVLDADIVHSTCLTDHHFDHMTITITGERQLSWFKSVSLVHAKLYLHYDDKDSDVFEVDGQYYFATRRLVLQPTTEGRLGFMCEFYGHDSSRCHGAIMHEATLEHCAEVILVRRDH